MRSKLGLAVVAIGAALALTLTGCSAESSESSEGAPSFKIATNAWIGYGPWYIAMDQGFDVEEGVALDLVNIEDPSAFRAAALSGDVDGANFATSDWLKNFDKLDMPVVLLQDVSTGADALVATSGINSLADLKGKRVAYQTGEFNEIMVDTALKQSGLTLADVTQVEIPVEQSAAALISGQADAAVMYEPHISAALAADSSLTSIYTAGENPGIIGDVLAVNSGFLKANPDVVTAVVKAWDRGVAYLAANPEKGRQIVADALGTPLADLTAAFDGVSYYTAADSVEQFSDVFPNVTAPMILDALKATGQITSTPDLSKAIDMSFAQSAVK
ncbi:ABC transporter substrate-binding protein [Glaciibacter psychrotolerans]|uniref:NitT/TauT family transport system substrate-binding protein n=1 Tax=Glaciibacter psychrotolerans TaxID=670054 RepID=A0A7Z0J7C9_9MICO|nr:ABC transporter substrate-binding protein [Leifsonia psychrotolerans]NYJ21472.1 NitT/TauT family transport system substrate-binding protein [Leifsonia psychrotolerans]